MAWISTLLETCSTEFPVLSEHGHLCFPAPSICRNHRAWLYHFCSGICSNSSDRDAESSFYECTLATNTTVQTIAWWSLLKSVDLSVSSSLRDRPDHPLQKYCKLFSTKWYLLSQNSMMIINSPLSTKLVLYPTMWGWLRFLSNIDSKKDCSFSFSLSCAYTIFLAIK